VSYFRNNIDAMKGYTPGEQPGEGDRVVKLNTNENPYPPSPAVMKIYRDTDWSRLRRYPDPMGNRVRDKLAGVLGIRRENILCGNGSDELLSLATRAFLDEGDVLAYPTPTYSLYPVLAEIQAATVLEIPTLGDFSLPVDDLASAKANLMFLCNPNAPTGVFTPVGAIGSIAERFSGVVVVDEAYVDFAADHALRLAKTLPNVMVFRTLSKSYSLAGLRFGYAVGPADLIEGLAKVKDSYNVDAVSIDVAVAALDDQAWMLGNREKIRSERARISARLTELGFAVTPSEANFILAAVPGGDGKAWYEGLKRRGILVRWWNLPRLADKLRVTVGTPEENDALLAALEQLGKR
jgi:histidinol-phosphate aminotransferase